MKKQSWLLPIIILFCLTLPSLGEHIYIYRNDRNFHHFRASTALPRISQVLDSRDSIVVSEPDIPEPGAFDLAISTPPAPIKDTIRIPVSLKLKVDFEDTSFTFDRETLDSIVIRGKNIPDIYVTLIDHPDWTDLKKDSEHTKKTTYAALLKMDGNGMHEDLAECEVEFRGRGNTTWMLPKTPYRFKFPKKKSLCGLQKAKTYALIANYIDPTGMRNNVALWLAAELGLPFTNHAVPVNVFFNGHFKGLYMMTEKIGIGSASVDIDETKGILLELDTGMDEDWQFYQWIDAGNGSAARLPVMVKDPDLDELFSEEEKTSEYWAMWKEEFANFTDAVMRKSDSLGEIVDMEDAARYLLVYNVMCNREILHPKSLFIYKRSLGETERWHFGPIWDFDWGSEWNFNPELPLLNGPASTTGAGNVFLSALVSHPQFREAYQRAWSEFKEEIYPRLWAYVDGLVQMEQAAFLENGMRWGSVDIWNRHVLSSYDYEESLEVFRNFIDSRIEFLSSDPDYGFFPRAEEDEDSE